MNFFSPIIALITRFIDWFRILFSIDLSNEGFEGTVFPPAGWVSEGNGIAQSGSIPWRRSPTNNAGQGGSQRAAQVYLTEATNFNEFLFSPMFTFAAGETVRVRCYVKKEPYDWRNANFRIHVCSAQTRSGSYRIISEVSFSNNNYQLVEASFPFPDPIGATPTRVCIGFQAQGMFGSGTVLFSLDNIRIRKTGY